MDSGFLASIVHNMPGGIAAVLGVGALGYAAFALRNWKLAVAAAVMLALFAYGQHRYAAGFNQRVADDVAAQTKILHARVATLESAAAADKARADADALVINDLQEQVAATPANTKPALPRDVVRRIMGVK